MRSIILSAALLFFLGASAFAQTPRQEAQFGLEWGMSSAQVRAMGVELQSRTDDVKDFGFSFSAIKLPKILADAEMVLLSFGFDDKLWRIATVSRSFPNDPYGNAVKKDMTNWSPF